MSAETAHWAALAACPIGLSSAALPGSVPDHICAAAAANGLDGIEWGIGQGQALMFGAPDTAVDRVADATAAAGLRCCGVSVHDDRALARPLADWLWLAGMARELGAPHVRVYATPLGIESGADFDSALNVLKSQLSERAAQLSLAGLRLLLEPAPRTLIPGLALAREALMKANPARVGVVYDPGSLAQEGWLDPFLAVGVLGPLLSHVHVKNIAPVRSANGWRWQHSTLGSGIVDWRRALEAVGSRNYLGWLVLDHLSSDQPDVLAGDVAELRQLLGNPS